MRIALLVTALFLLMPLVPMAEARGITVSGGCVTSDSRAYENKICIADCPDTCIRTGHSELCTRPPYPVSSCTALPSCQADLRLGSEWWGGCTGPRVCATTSPPLACLQPIGGCGVPRDSGELQTTIQCW